MVSNSVLPEQEDPGVSRPSASDHGLDVVVADVVVQRAERQQSMLGDGVQTLLTNLVQVVCVLTATSVIARTLGPSVKGAYDLCLATAQLLFTTTCFSLPSGLTYVVASGAGDARRWRMVVYWLAVGLGLLAVGMLLGAYGLGYLNALLPASLGLGGVAWVSLTTALLAGSAFSRALLVGRREFRRANLGDLAKQGSILALLPLAVSAARSRAAGFQVGLFLAINVLATLCALFTYDTPLRQSVPTTKRLEWDIVIRFGLPGYLSDMLQFINYRLGIYYINVHSGTRDVGLFQSAAFLCQSLWLLPTAIAAITFPHVANASSRGDDQSRTTALCSRLALWTGLAFALPLALVSPIVIPLCFGPAFKDSVVLLWLMLPGTVGLCPAKVIASHLAGIGRPRFNLIGSAIGAVTTVVLTAALAPKYGAKGAAVAMSVSHILNACVLMAFFVRQSKIPTSLVLFPGNEEVVLLRKGEQRCRLLWAELRTKIS